LRFIVILLLLVMTCLAWGQQSSVKPGINESFEDPDVAGFVERFENEDREIYVFREQIVEELHLESDWHVADIGAGTGFLTRMIAAKVPQGRVFAVDIAEKFLTHIEKTSREADLNNVETVLGAERESNLAPESLDLAFVCDSFHHFEYPKDYARNLHKVLKPNGLLVIVDFIKEEGSRQWVIDHVHFDRDQVIALLEEMGFDYVGEATFMDEQYMIKLRKKQQ